jgi:homocysteine S-methyltransferase
MLSKAQFTDLLTTEHTLILDGALATELEVRGHDLNHALWSAKVLRDDPASIQQVHRDYYRSGAHVAITASYQSSTAGLTQHFHLSQAAGEALNRRSVQAAQDARAEAYRDDGVDGARPLLVAGGVGPYGAYLADGSEYTGAYVRGEAELRDFHRPRIAALVDAGVDLLALETMPNLVEIRAVLALLRDEFPGVIAWLSCTVRDAGHLSDGTPWRDVLDVVNPYEDRIVGFGINCFPADLATSTLKRLAELTRIPLVCYPNSGETYDAKTYTWSGERPDDQALLLRIQEWMDNGARLIGGCCRTGPAYVAAIRDHLAK